MSVVGSFLTALVGGVVAAFLTFWLNATKEHVFFMRRKAEDLYIATRNFHMLWRSFNRSHFEGLKKISSGDDYKGYSEDKDRKIGDKLNDYNATMYMISRMYFPQIEELLDNALDKGDIVGGSLKELMDKMDKSEWTASDFDNHELKLQQWEDATTAFEEAIIVEASKLGREERFLPLPIAAARYVWERLFGRGQVPRTETR